MNFEIISNGQFVKGPSRTTNVVCASGCFQLWLAQQKRNFRSTNPSCPITPAVKSLNAVCGCLEDGSFFNASITNGVCAAD
ncbi:MAG: hypothetical protein FWG68_09005 [Defluviitaleaceae bacterium]|nr:hypothetical protein [Defluviitaleaceae bacterium]